jgi:hypothetical protein
VQKSFINIEDIMDKTSDKNNIVFIKKDLINKKPC